MNSPTATELAPTPQDLAPDAAPGLDAAATDRVLTKLKFASTPQKAWENLMFYEQITDPPPLHLRRLLPMPIRTEGRKSEVGDEALCLYEGGHLLKRIVDIDAPNHYFFEVVEQDLAFGGGMRLSRGGYRIRDLGDGRCEVSLETNYTSTKRPRALWRPIEAVVAHSFHRHILRSMRKVAEAA